MEFLLIPQNLPFAVALTVMLAIALLEGALTLVGLGFSSLLDNLIPEGFGAEALGDLELDADLDLDGDLAPAGGIDPCTIDPGASLDPSGAGDIGSASALSRVLGWLCVGRVPVLVLVVVFLTVFGLDGLLIQGLLQGLTTFLLPAWIAWVPALALALPMTSRIGRGIARIIPKDETSAVSRESLIGRLATVTLGEARQGAPAQARVRDENGKSHYVMVEPDDPERAFRAGEPVLLVTRHGAVFRAIENTSAALVDE